MSGFLRPRNIAIAGGIGAAVLFFPRTQKKANEISPIGNVFETQAVQNIGDRYSSGGGTNTHMPGAASKRGTAGTSDNSTSVEQKGIGTAHFNENLADQKVENPNVLGRSFGKGTSGSEKGK